MTLDSTHLQKISEKMQENKEIFSCGDDCGYDEECISRSIINRSYYAAYSDLKIWASKEFEYDENKVWKEYKSAKKSQSNIGRHEVLIKYMSKNSHKLTNEYLGYQCASLLKEMKPVRTDADYKFHKNISAVEAETVYKNSAKIIKFVNKLYEDASKGNLYKK